MATKTTSIKIEEYIPEGKENAVTRMSLCMRTGLPDRLVRREIEAARKRGVPILSSSMTSGYWISTDTKEVLQYLSECDRRARSLHITNAALRKWCYDKQGIKTVVVHEHMRKVGSAPSTE